MLANLIISVLPLDINSHHLHCAPPCLSILYDEDGTMLSPVWSQFGANSGRISSIDTVAVTSSRNTFLQILKCSPVYLYLDIVAFLWTNFILLSKGHAQYFVSSTDTPYSTSDDRFNFFSILRAEMMTTLEFTAPFSSLIFLRYAWTLQPTSDPRITFRPCFLAERISFPLYKLLSALLASFNSIQINLKG